MKKISLSGIVTAVMVTAVIVVLYSLVIGPMYRHGLWPIDMAVLLLAAALMVFGAAGTIGITGNLTTQAVARWNVFRTCGVFLILLTAVHTGCCIFLNANIELYYWILLGAILACYAVKFFFVDAGARQQEEIEQRQNATIAAHRAVAANVKGPTARLLAVVSAAPCSPASRQVASAALRAVADKIGGISVNAVEHNAALTSEIYRWAERLGELASTSSAKMTDTTLASIASEARAEYDLLNSMR